VVNHNVGYIVVLKLHYGANTKTIMTFKNHNVSVIVVRRHYIIGSLVPSVVETLKMAHTYGAHNLLEVN
jgi:hypothetical protein